MRLRRPGSAGPAGAGRAAGFAPLRAGRDVLPGPRLRRASRASAIGAEEASVDLADRVTLDASHAWVRSDRGSSNHFAVEADVELDRSLEAGAGWSLSLSAGEKDSMPFGVVTWRPQDETEGQ